MMNLEVTPEVTTARPTSPARLRVWVATAMLAALVMSSFASAVTMSGALVADDAGATPKLYHAALLLAGALIAFRGRIARPRSEMLVYFAVMIAATLLAYAANEPRVAGVKLLIAFYVALVAGGVGRAAGRAVVLRACRVASVAFLVLVTAKNLQHIPAFVMYLASPIGHPDVPTLAGGGLNLEATWLALASVFLIGTAFFVPFVLTAAATSALYASRAGIVIAALAACAALAYAWGSRRAEPVDAAGRRLVRRRRSRIIAFVVAAIALGATAAAVRAVRQVGDPTYVAQRFATIGEEPGSMGRMTLWRGGLRVFAEFPLGVGVGNAVPTLRRVLGVDVPEDNLHNIYLQHAVETGIPGLVALLVLAVTVARRPIAVRFRDHLLLFVAGYFVAGAIQFTGVDVMLWLVYGLQSGVSSGGGDG
jgi:O-antigen ligase